jgi:NADPH-dependent 2,4-dienoyl-CoA reductase/sulfur reductase-like enzyme
MNRLLIVVFVVIGGVAGGAAADLREYKRAKKKDPKVTFDYSEAWPRWVAGGFAGLAGGSALALLKVEPNP